jgi:hypothetical protein
MCSNIVFRKVPRTQEDVPAWVKSLKIAELKELLQYLKVDVPASAKSKDKLIKEVSKYAMSKRNEMGFWAVV